LGYSAVFNENMDSLTLSGVYNLINRSGRHFNANSVTLEQFTDSSMDLKEALILMDGEDMNLQFVSNLELRVTQEEVPWCTIGQSGCRAGS